MINFINKKNFIEQCDLEKLTEKILWRMSTEAATNHYILRDKEEYLSLFALNNKCDIENDGFNFLVFMFCGPLKNVFLNINRRNELSEKISLKLHIYNLQLLLKTSDTIRERFSKLKISKHQKYDLATHWELHFDDPSATLDPEVIHALHVNTQQSPAIPDPDFMSRIFEKCDIECRKDGLNGNLK